MPNSTEDIIDLRSLEWSEVSTWLKEEEITTHKMNESVWRRSSVEDRRSFLKDICMVISYFSNPEKPLGLYHQWGVEYGDNNETSKQNENEDQMEPSYIDLGGEGG